jgi:hypothetical protein
MRRALAACAAALALAAPAAAQTPPERITIVALFDPIYFGQKTFVNGQLIGGDNAGQIVTLQEAPFPFTTWSDVAQITTDYQGYYSFMRRPALTTYYRTVWNGQVMSEQQVQVRVFPRLSFHASRLNSKTVRFAGTLAPAHPDQAIQIQRQTGSGWRTVASYTLRGGGSTFAGRLRAHHAVRLRAFFPSQGDVVPAYSVAVTVPKP